MSRGPDGHAAPLTTGHFAMGSFVPTIRGRYYGEQPAEKPADAGHLDRFLDALTDAQTVTVRCAWCPRWRFTGTADVAREASLEHRKETHPETLKKRKKPLPAVGNGLGPKPMWQQSLEDRQAVRLRGAAANKREAA